MEEPGWAAVWSREADGWNSLSSNYPRASIHSGRVVRTPRAFGSDALLLVASSRDPQRHPARLSGNNSRGSNAALRQIRRDRRSYDNNALSNLPVAHLPASVIGPIRGSLCHYMTEISCKIKQKNNCLRRADALCDLECWERLCCQHMGDSQIHARAPLYSAHSTNRVTTANANAGFSICQCRACGSERARACLLRHQGPCEGHSCLRVGHRWLHRLLPPTMTTLPLLSPSPSSCFYASAEYFPPDNSLSSLLIDIFLRPARI